MCTHCRMKKGRYPCDRQDCGHVLCTYCVEFRGDSAYCEDCLRLSACRVTE